MKQVCFFSSERRAHVVQMRVWRVLRNVVVQVQVARCLVVMVVVNRLWSGVVVHMGHVYMLAGANSIAAAVQQVARVLANWKALWCQVWSSLVPHE